MYRTAGEQGEAQHQQSFFYLYLSGANKFALRKKNSPVIYPGCFDLPF